MRVTTTPPLSRREANKARTREALLDTLGELVRGGGVEGITVEAVAEGAGVSRRTFFNYFASIESALAESMAVPVAELAAGLLSRPADEEPLVAMRRTLEAVPLPHELLAWLHAVHSSDSVEHPVSVRVWDYHREWLEGLVAQRLGDQDPLRVATLAGAVMSIFESVERVWVDRTDSVDAAAVAEFNTMLGRALQHARDGWATGGSGPTT